MGGGGSVADSGHPGLQVTFLAAQASFGCIWSWGRSRIPRGLRCGLRCGLRRTKKCPGMASRTRRERASWWCQGGNVPLNTRLWWPSAWAHKA
eukprot:scaffold15170_cov27-Attheya_sp.AAC.1